MGNKNNQDFAGMNSDKQEDIASEGGKSQGQENNPGNFANDREKASEAGQKGGQSSQKRDDSSSMTSEDKNEDSLLESSFKSEE